MENQTFPIKIDPKYLQPAKDLRDKILKGGPQNFKFGDFIKFHAAQEQMWDDLAAAYNLDRDKYVYRLNIKTNELTLEGPADDANGDGDNDPVHRLFN